MLTVLLAFLVTSEAKPPPQPTPITFSSTLSDWAVLQREPARARVYGLLGDGGTAATVKLSSGGAGAAETKVVASIKSDGQSWEALLPAQAAGGNYTITASCTGCTNSTPARLSDITFGDVWVSGIAI